MVIFNPTHRSLLNPYKISLFVGSALIGLALLSVRLIAIEFRLGTTTEQHPISLLVTLLLFAGFLWLGLVCLFRKQFRQSEGSGTGPDPRTFVVLAILIGVGFRALFFGSTPIYEDDWNRYLWDGFVITQGENPYVYSPAVIDSAASDDFRVKNLNELSEQNGAFVERINNAHLTTIYPPVAQAVFAVSALVKPLSLDSLRGLYLLSEFLTMLLMVKALTLFGRSKAWVWIYAVNPIVIFTAFNGAHMDILLVPLILSAIILVKRHPLMSAVCLACAVAVKIWPLILGPILFREYRTKPVRYIAYGAFLGVSSLLLCAPMILTLGTDSGLGAYSSAWQRSSFLFPRLETFMSALVSQSALVTRGLVALIIGLTAVWLSFRKGHDAFKSPDALMAITLLLYILSPTGFPWYVIWFTFLIPFVPSYGAALLCVMVSLYYSHFWLGENGHYDIYLDLLIPLQFGLPILVLLFEICRKNMRDRI